MHARSRAQLAHEIATVGRDGSPGERVDLETGELLGQQPGRESFGRWLAAQHDRGDWIDALAFAMRLDRTLPRDATVAQVRARLQALGADGDAFEQLEDAERCWRSL